MKDKIIIYPYSHKQPVKDYFSAIKKTNISKVELNEMTLEHFSDREEANRMLRLIHSNPYTKMIYRDKQHRVRISFKDEFKRRYMILYVCGKEHREIMHILGYPYRFMLNNIYGISPTIFEQEFINSEKEVWEKIRQEVKEKLIKTQ